MARPPRSIRRALRVAALLVAGASSLIGCASPEGSRYEEQLRDVVAPSAAVNDDVAVAFGLDGYETTMIAAVMPEGAILAE